MYKQIYIDFWLNLIDIWYVISFNLFPDNKQGFSYLFTCSGRTSRCLVLKLLIITTFLHIHLYSQEEKKTKQNPYIFLVIYW